MAESDGRSKNIERENRILNATATLIVRYGYDKTSVNDIAKEAGISKGAVYLHFDSKDDLLFALILRETLKTLDAWRIRFQDDTSPKVFASMYRHFLKATQENEFLWTMYSKQQWLLGTSFTKRLSGDLYQQRMGLSLSLLMQLHAVGAIRQDITPAITAYIFNMLNYGYLKFAEMIPAEQAPPADALINEVGELIQSYLEPDDGGNPVAAREIIINMLSASTQFIKNMLEKQ